jgi:hypothetical protein
MDDNAARAVLAGFITGYTMGIVFTGAAAVLLVRLRRRFAVLEYAISPTLSPLAVAVPVSLMAFLLWTAVGMVLGVVFYALEDIAPRGGLGSPNLAFTMFVLASALLPTAPWLYLFRAVRQPLAAAIVFYIALFGWALPHLAD